MRARQGGFRNGALWNVEMVVQGGYNCARQLHGFNVDDDDCSLSSFEDHILCDRGEKERFDRNVAGDLRVDFPSFWKGNPRTCR